LQLDLLLFFAAATGLPFRGISNRVSNACALETARALTYSDVKRY
jgi:hypothetical protein